MNARQILPHALSRAARFVRTSARLRFEFVRRSHRSRGMLLARRCKMRFVKAMTDPRVTFAELQTWPDDGRRYELYDGEVIVVPSPFLRHQRVEMHLVDILPQ